MLSDTCSTKSKLLLSSLKMMLRSESDSFVIRRFLRFAQNATEEIPHGSHTKENFLPLFNFTVLQRGSRHAPTFFKTKEIGSNEIYVNVISNVVKQWMETVAS